MNKILTRSISLALLLSLAGCGSLHPTALLSPTTSQISILQAGKDVIPEKRESNLTHYRLKAPFVIRIQALPNTQAPIAVQVCASTNARIFDQIRPNIHVGQVPCYTPGTGMATSVQGEDPRNLYLYLSDGNGHNYYSADRRIDTRSHIDIHVAGVKTENNKILSSGVVYAIVFIDTHKNGVMEDAEYQFLELTLHENVR